MNRQLSKPWARALAALFAAGLISCACGQKAAAQSDANAGSSADAVAVQDFENRVADYVKLHKAASGSVSRVKKPTDSAEKIEHYQHALREAIQARRQGVTQGNIFTPPICAQFRRLVGAAYRSDSSHIRTSLRTSEPGTAKVQIRVNHRYPDDEPLQTMPPSLLLNLPNLSPELEYRIVGRNLVLRDVEANMIVDVIPRIIPQ